MGYLLWVTRKPNGVANHLLFKVVFAGLFLGVYMLTIAIAIIASAVIMHIDAEGLKGQPLPKWVKEWFILRIGKWLHVNGRMDIKCFPEKEVCYNFVYYTY